MSTLHLHDRLQDFIASTTHPLIVVLGPTASGKTSFSIELAANIPGAEIINADSRQLYRHLDIGTAKITKEEMRGIPHHLLDVLDPKEEATAAWYKNQAKRIIDEIHSRKHVPVLVGGSMLYISAVTDDLKFPTERDLRQSLQIRKEMKPRDDLFIIGIDRPRDQVMERINQRTKELFDRGWVEEVRGLLAMGCTADDPAMKSHGYREIMDFLQTGKPSLPELQENISANSRQYAKRQITWWRNDSRIQWITPT